MAKLWYVICKDLRIEVRSRRAWPAMLLLGTVVAVMFTVQMRLSAEQQQQNLGALLWLAVFFAGMLGIDRSFASEQTDGCWDALGAYPVSPAVIYWSKVLVNFTALIVLEGLLIPLFAALADTELLRQPFAICLVAVLTSLGLSAVGTLLSAVANGMGMGGQLIALLALPLCIPALLAAAEATRLIAMNQIDGEWWRWIQLLGCFAVTFVTAGTLLFEFAIGE